ncbi:PAQR family membrane homeostasis protein TrhA [Actinomyces trachealis]|uniref:PAQR family membrane homeostasis protein TrhA n=1 Tax=Actinomyces trachealis TaxID=2763540 RepID=UPI0018929B7D|nr:hemolysin III family protein [Actinomyces trachealis]
MTIRTLFSGNPPDFLKTPPKPPGFTRPKLRGWIHTITAPLVIAACVVLTVLAAQQRGAAMAWACATYLACSTLLFVNSGVYHLCKGRTPKRFTDVLQHIDHANIYLLIGGTYTLLAVALLTPLWATILLVVVWIGAAVGIAARFIWPRTPRWLGAVIYVALGWVALAFLPHFWATGGPTIVLLLVIGGVLYTIGAIVFTRQMPDPNPLVFGFHEIFHVFTVVAWACHCVACYLAVLN